MWQVNESSLDVGRRMSAEAIVLCGAGAAILMQIAHPAVAAGVARHSDFAQDPLRRLEGTLNYVIAVVHGTERDRELVRARVNRAHSFVRGEGYDADDAELQRCVATTLYVAARDAHARAFGEANLAASQSLLNCFEAIGTELGMPAGSWPSSIAEFDRWWEAELVNKHVGEDARGIFWQLRHPAGAPWLIRIMMPAILRISLAQLPAKLRKEFCPGWTKRDRFLVELFWAVMVPVYRLLPRRVRTAHIGWQLRQLRASAKSK